MTTAWLLAIMAQSFFDNSPGPLAAGHAELNNPDACGDCHELGGGVTDFKCLDCHQHNGLRDAIKKGRGLHATFKQACTVCHTDHRGRSANINDWSKIGGRRGLDHAKTGFSLSGAHEKVACTKCHLKKLKSGRTSYASVKRTCDGCHKNNHRFTAKDLRARGACEKCHGADGGKAETMTAADLFFDHGKRTGLALTGRHGDASCVDCHANAKMSMKRKRKCAQCHKSPHGRAFKRSRCQDCHQVDRSFAKASFSHESTRFPLRAKHRTNRCGKCHVTAKRKPKPTCQPCHQDPHRKRFAEIDCEDCHAELGASPKAKAMVHVKTTGYALTGKHEQLDCRSCHRGRRPHKFERLEEGGTCRSCHAHTNAHDGQFADKECQTCHVEGGSNKLAFNHTTDTRFPLTGLHEEVDCEQCHPNGKFNTPGKLECVQCHEDSHQGQLGEDCQRCHQTSVQFAAIEFDHDRLSKFPLVGLHREVNCEKCHPNRKYKTGKSKCVTCHLEDDPHEGALGADCAQCHEPVKGAPKFEHTSMTAFAITGAHREVDCSRCHQSKPVQEPTPKLDLHFPVVGQQCADCHQDVHEGAYGTQCASCHHTGSFKNAKRAVHDTGAFRLMGTHDRLDCRRCHQTDRLLTGLGNQCIECHRQDDVHNNALGFECGDCHQQLEWTPPRFNHTRVGFILRGSHRTAQCRDCHGVGVYAGTPQACDSCHISEAMQVQAPPHTPEMMDCAQCHAQSAFVPAKRFHPWYVLRGVHGAASCASCHDNGTYAGTPRDCVGCHEEDYVRPSNEPNHLSAQIPNRCESCHVESAWEGARYQHQTFVRRGVHRAVSCGDCHPDGGYVGAMGGTVNSFDCMACHGAGAPKDEWPSDHDQSGYPPTCEFCHSELGWKPARSPR